MEKANLKWVVLKTKHKRRKIVCQTLRGQVSILRFKNWRATTCATPVYSNRSACLKRRATPQKWPPQLRCTSTWWVSTPCSCTAKISPRAKVTLWDNQVFSKMFTNDLTEHRPFICLRLLVPANNSKQYSSTKFDFFSQTALSSTN